MAAAISNELIRNMIFEINPLAKRLTLDPQTPLFDVGALDSYSIIVLVQTFEDRLDIIFDYSDMRPYFFQSIESLAKMLMTKYNCTQA